MTDLTALAASLARAIADHPRGKVPINVLLAAAHRSDSSLAAAPDARERVLLAIREIETDGLVRLPVGGAGWDTTVRPPLPTFVTRPPGARPARAPAPAVVWHADLGWAATPFASGTFSDDEAALLRTINDALFAGGLRGTVPLAERSVELTGNAKLLDQLSRNRRLFGPGKLSLDILGAIKTPPPFVWARVGDGPVILVVENAATFHTLRILAPAGSPLGFVAFGAAYAFPPAVEYVTELGASDIRYFGDLDEDGLEIARRAAETAASLDLPAVRPAVGLYARLLGHGRPTTVPEVDAARASRLVEWLPATLRAQAYQRLVDGERLEQEAIGVNVLADDPTWADWSSLGPRAGEQIGRVDPAAHRPIDERREAPLDLDGVIDGTWIAAARTRNWVKGDPLLDWLRAYGRDKGFVPDDERPDYDPRTDFTRFVMAKGQAFEAGIVRVIAERATVVTVARERGDAYSPDKAAETVEAMRAGAPIIAQGVLRNPQTRTYGVADLLMRSDLIADWFPELLSPEEAHNEAPALGQARFHYRAVDIKFHGFDLTTDGHVGTSADQLAYAVQVWLYNDALGLAQGYTPPSSYLLGRTWKAGDERGEGALERLGRVDQDRWLPHRESTIEDVARAAVAWMRRLRAEGGAWDVLPRPSIPELYPHMRNLMDSPWHAAKREIAAELGELTLLPAMNPDRRAAAHAAGIDQWADEGLTAAGVGVASPAFGARLDGVLAANRSDTPVVLPERITNADPVWREIPETEFWVDFETVSNLDDDFTALPKVGGYPQIVMIGCGQFDAEGNWAFAQWTVDALTADEERRIIEAWVEHMAATGLDHARICHWSAAEPVNLENAYNSARVRHDDADWPTGLPWFDMLQAVVRAEPVTVTGAFGFGLKAIAKAMNAAGLIGTTWGDGPTDGLGAMVGTWKAAADTRAAGTPLSEHPLMVEIGEYNEVDCRAMAEVVTWLRENR